MSGRISAGYYGVADILMMIPKDTHATFNAHVLFTSNNTHIGRAVLARAELVSMTVSQIRVRCESRVACTRDHHDPGGKPATRLSRMVTANGFGNALFRAFKTNCALCSVSVCICDGYTIRGTLQD